MHRYPPTVHSTSARIRARARFACFEFFDFAHVLFGKPVPTFSEHALAGRNAASLIWLVFSLPAPRKLENHLAQGFMSSLDLAGKLGAAFDQAAHNKDVHRENKPQNHGFVALTPIRIITITMMAAIKSAQRSHCRHGMPDGI